MAFIPESLIVSRLDAENWELEHSIYYQGRDQRFTVPKGFVTDFASVPRMFTWLIPKYGKYTLAAILHDYLCTVGIMTGIVSSRDADGLFRRSMRELGVPLIPRWLMWTGVRWGALANPLRRPGILSDLPMVLFLSALILPVILPAFIGIVFALTIYHTLSLILGV